MKQIVTLVDYGASNIHSVQKAFEHIGARTQLTADPDTVRQADKLALPGVGAFGSRMDGLRRHDLPAAIRETVRRNGRTRLDRLRLPLRFCRGPGQRLRPAISPGKEPERGAAYSGKFCREDVTGYVYDLSGD